MLYCIVYHVCYRHLKYLCAELISRLFHCFPCPWSLCLSSLGNVRCLVSSFEHPSLRGALGVCQPDFWEIKSSCQISFLPTEHSIRQLTSTLFINSCAFIQLIICWLSCAPGNLHPQLTFFSVQEQQRRDVVWASRWSGTALQVRRWGRAQHGARTSLSSLVTTYPRPWKLELWHSHHCQRTELNHSFLSLGTMSSSS